MGEIAIDLNILEYSEGRDLFEELASRIEQLSIEGTNAEEIENLEKTLLFIERQFQDFQDTDSEKAKVVGQAVAANIVMLDAGQPAPLALMKRNLASIKNVCVGLTTSQIVDSDSYLLGNIIRHDNLQKGKKGTITITELSNAFNSVFNSPKEKLYANEIEWIIDLSFKTTKENNHKPLEFIHILIEGLNTIPGVKVTLEDIKIGTIQAKIKAIIDGVSSKEEVKEVLESARKFAKGKLEKEFSEIQKSDSETQKNQIESKILEETLQNLLSDGNKELKKLESESLKYDIERKKLENDRLKLQLFKERKELLKELLAEGFIAQKDLEMWVKGISFIKIENNVLTVGENIDIIDNL